MKDTLNCGIVGFGYMGQIRRTVIERNPELQLVGICEKDDQRRAAIKDCPTFASLDELLRQDVDLIFVCTPNNISPQVCIEAMKRGKHVFCEKPPGQSVEDIQDIMSYENDKVKLMFGFNHRFHPGIVKAKVIVDSGSIGSIVAMRGIYGKSGGVQFHKSWRNDRKISGGGILLDQGIHMLDLFCYFCGGFQEVKAFTSNRYWQFEVEDNACVMLKNTKEQIAMLHSSATFWRHQFQLHIILEKGYLTVEGLLSKTGSYGRETLTIGRQQFEDETEALGNPSEEIVYFDNDRSWEIEVKEMVKYIKNDLPVTMSASADAYNVMCLVREAYRDSSDVKTYANIGEGE